LLNWNGSTMHLKKIAEALTHKSTDDLEIVELKRQKMRLKDEIERLRHGGVHDDLH
jgi:hypothetical protein